MDHWKFGDWFPTEMWRPKNEDSIDSLIRYFRQSLVVFKKTNHVYPYGISQYPIIAPPQYPVKIMFPYFTRHPSPMVIEPWPSRHQAHPHRFCLGELGATTGQLVHWSWHAAKRMEDAEEKHGQSGWSGICSPDSAGASPQTWTPFGKWQHL
jgi:hypothetical protein